MMARRALCPEIGRLGTTKLGKPQFAPNLRCVGDDVASFMTLARVASLYELDPP